VLKVLYNRVSLKHAPPFPHPERPERLEIALAALKTVVETEIVETPSAAREDLFRVHSPEYVIRIERYVETGVSMLDSDTYLCRGSMMAALAAAGASLAAAEAAVNGFTAFALTRPPGHHAGWKGTAMGAPTQGFCIFNNAALTVARLLELGTRKVAVVDFDAHHGNGTQEIFYSDPRVLHIDLHEDPATLYPGTGFPTDLGEGEAEGTKVNLILPPGSSDDVYELALKEIVILLLEEFRPEAIVFSAGFDAYDGDGLTHLRAGSRTYALLGRLPRELGISRVAAILEGGYSVGLRQGLPAFAASLAGSQAEFKAQTSPKPVLSLAEEYVTELKGLLRRYWKL